jgi:hypothetical protein
MEIRSVQDQSKRTSQFLQAVVAMLSGVAHDLVISALRIP